MTERPILFRPELVRAILEGRKTVTRRIVRIPEFFSCPEAGEEDCTKIEWSETGHGGPGYYLSCTELPDEGSVVLNCPYGSPGDRLWVRETWAEGWTYQAEERCVFYKADGLALIGSSDHPVADVAAGRFGIPNRGGDGTAPEKTKWHPSIFMPRWASRLTLEVVSVRVERLQEITIRDAIAEGIRCAVENERSWGYDERKEYAKLWDSLNRKRAPWASNPWVWRIEFRKVAA